MSWTQRLLHGARGETVLAGLMIATLAVMIVPLPQIVLDVLITADIALAVLILFTTLSAREPLEFSTLPSVLLLATLCRLALNVASSRLILLEGEAGAVIEAFGTFVVGGNLVVGGVMFLILIIIQFVVITKGAGRVSEVAARFTLDALPGKQMAIDADLGAGLINESEAKTRRERVGREAEFYGAMDGASKFVRGDAIAGLLITAINILGGLAIGISKGMSAGEALHVYAILTVGDGLVSQIPALVISVAAGAITVKSASKARLADDLHVELLTKPRALAGVVVVILAFALIPGIPIIPFVCVAGGAGALLWWQRKQDGESESEEPGPGSALASPGATPEEAREALRVDRIVLELGFGITALGDTERGGELVERVALLRRSVASEAGWLVPALRLRESFEIDPHSYRILILGYEVATGSLEPGRYLAIGGPDTSGSLPGTKTTEPTFGQPAVWIDPSERANAELNGYTVADPTTVVVTHLGETLRLHAHELLGRDEVQELLDDLKERAPAVVNEICPGLLNLGQIQRSLSGLLRDRVPLRPLETILEALADQAAEDKNPTKLIEAARLRNVRAVTAPFLDASGRLAIMTLEPAIERRLIESVAGGGGLPSGGLLSKLMEAIRSGRADAESRAGAAEPVLVVQGTLRPGLAELIRPSLPRLAVLSYSELGGAREIESLGVISLPVSEGVPA
ncbi:MAG: FHIPEP family type III secretion protein [Planctomycetes bacterium]|nr:FHIPEP family type III secretion protein [Planctomycetota bacterium]